MLPQAQDSLNLLQPSRCGLLAGPLSPVLLAVALDPGDAAIPCLSLRRIAQPLSQLLCDVGGAGKGARR